MYAQLLSSILALHMHARTHAGWTGELYRVPLFSSGPVQGGALGKSFVHRTREGGPPIDSVLMDIGGGWSGIFGPPRKSPRLNVKYLEPHFKD